MSRPPALSPQLAALSDDEVHTRRALAHDRLQACATRAEADALYKDVLLPLEREGVWRDGRSNPDAEVELLFVTVGNQADTPIHAMLYWRARYVVLLHTDDKHEVAVDAAEQCGLSIGAGTVQTVGSGTDPTRLYREVQAIWQQRGRPDGTVIDLTGGYKAMSGAAAAVGFVLPHARVSYVETSQPRVHGRPFWLDTRILLLENPLAVFGELERATARRLLREGQYGASARVWSELADQTRNPIDRWHAELAEGLRLQEALQFGPAAEALERMASSIDKEIRRTPALAREGLASVESRGWLTRRVEGLRGAETIVRLSGKGDPMREKSALTDPAMSELVALMLGLAKQHVDRSDGDLASLYAYRASEALVQQHIARRGFDIQKFDWESALQSAGVAEDERDRRLRQVLGLKARAALPPLPDKISRGLGLSILCHLFQDPRFAPELVKKLSKQGDMRNRSLLAHGISRVAPKSADALLQTTLELFGELSEASSGESDSWTHWQQALPPGVHA